MNPTITPGFIRDHHPCYEGWTTLYKALDGAPANTELTIGNIVCSNNAADALWCLDLLRPHSDLLRQQVVRAILLPALERNRLAPFVGVTDGWDHVPNLMAIKRWAYSGDQTLLSDELSPRSFAGLATDQIEAIRGVRAAFIELVRYAKDPCCEASTYAIGALIRRVAGLMAQRTYPGYPSEVVARFEEDAQTGDIIRTFTPHFFRN